MSFDAKCTCNVPDQTAQVARAIFPKGNPVMRLHDDLHMVVGDRDFASLFPTRGRPAEAPVRLALATLLQSMEGLTDRQAANAVRTRIDWKYLLCLELTDVGFDHTVLSEFRTRLLAHGVEGRPMTPSRNASSGWFTKWQAMVGGVATGAGSDPTRNPFCRT